MRRDEISAWLRETDRSRLEQLWRQADEVRRQNVGDEVHLRGLIEISNHCVRECHYCGLRGPNRRLPRYRMTAAEILACAHQARALGCGTVVLQSGEDPGLTAEWIADLVRNICVATGLAVTLSLGERDFAELAAWREAGASRYLLKFETSNRALLNRIHPPRDPQRPDRFAILRHLRGLGYEIGSGIMVGIPGQSWEDLTDDLLCIQALELDMVAVGPFIPHPQTPLGAAGSASDHPDQVPNDPVTTCKVLALARLLAPLANIPSTTALATIGGTSARELGLRCGANVLMPSLTPARYRSSYEIYPDRASFGTSGGLSRAELENRIQSLGRRPGVGRGDSPNYHRRPRGQTCHDVAAG